MIDVKLYAFTLLCCSSAAAFIEFLSPKSCKKQLSLITGIIILICIASPFKNLKTVDFSLSVKAPSVSAAVSTDQILAEQFSERVSKIISEKLETIGIFARDIRIEISIQNDEVKIEKAVIILDDKDRERATEVSKFLSEQLKINIVAAIE